MKSVLNTTLLLVIAYVAILSTARLVAIAGLISDYGVVPNYKGIYSANNWAGRGASPFYPRSLADRTPGTFWHSIGSGDPGYVAVGPGEGWVMIDLGAGEEQSFNYLRARPRPGHGHLFWKEAYLEGSQDGTSFEMITRVHQSSQPTGGWLIWSVYNPNKYQFYRLVMNNSHGGPLVFSDLELLTTLPLVQKLVPWLGDTPGDNRPVTRFWSSPYLDKNYTPAQLADDNAGTFWHAVGPGEGWVMIDLGAGEEQSFNYLRARPRPGHGHLFWKEAYLEGSQDGTSFEMITRVDQSSQPTTENWLKWSFSNPNKYQFYRLVMKNSHGGPLAFSDLEIDTKEAIRW